MEVAQIDWDGATTSVNWTTIVAIVEHDGTPRLVLVDGILRGASGGGVFHNDYHVANNWTLIKRLDATGAFVDHASTAALDPAQIAH